MKKIYVSVLTSFLSAFVTSSLFAAPIKSAAVVLTGEAGVNAPGFDSDYNAAVRRAKQSSRNIFILFTGSDWCSWCNKLESEVLSQKAFLEYATNEWELVIADFPKNKRISPELRKQNLELKKKYGIQGFPTVLLVDADGKKLCASGYSKGGAEVWLKKFIKEKELAPLAKKFLGSIEKKINDLDEKVVKELLNTPSIKEKDIKAVHQHRKNVAVKYLPEVKALIKELESIQVSSALLERKAKVMEGLKFMNSELQRTVDAQ